MRNTSTCLLYEAHTGDSTDEYSILMEETWRKRELGKRKHRWKKNITPKMGLQELRRSMDFIDLTQDRDRWRASVNAVMNLLFP